MTTVCPVVALPKHFSEGSRTSDIRPDTLPCYLYLLFIPLIIIITFCLDTCYSRFLSTYIFLSLQYLVEYCLKTFHAYDLKSLSHYISRTDKHELGSSNWNHVPYITAHPQHNTQSIRSYICCARAHSLHTPALFILHYFFGR